VVEGHRKAGNSETTGLQNLKDSRCRRERRDWLDRNYRGSSFQSVRENLEPTYRIAFHSNAKGGPCGSYKENLNGVGKRFTKKSATKGGGELRGYLVKDLEIIHF